MFLYPLHGVSYSGLHGRQQKKTMTVTLDLLALYGAEIVNVDGMRCVQIPVEYNGKEILYPNGTPGVMATFWLNRAHRGKADWKGIVAPPDSMKDKLLEQLELPKPRTCIWAYDNKAKSPVSRGDFEAIMNKKGRG